MLSLHLYHRSDGPSPSSQYLHQVLRQHGAQLQESDTFYHSGFWRDEATRAYVDIDSGPLPLRSITPASTHHDDANAQPKDYPGWTPREVSFHIPLNGPHWLVVEIARWLEAVLQDLPDCGILINEDTGLEGEPGYGPGPVERLRLLRCWEFCHMEQCASLATPLMARSSSLALWRYRRELPHGQNHYPHLHWPQALVLSRNTQAHAVAVWQDPTLAWALPPVEYIVVQRAHETGLIPSDEILTAAADQAQALSAGAAHAIAPCASIKKLFSQASLMPPQPFVHCHDHDWSDTPVIRQAETPVDEQEHRSP
ncbi:MAG: hypothetical protein EA401_11270 [Planctomycetota bacterium]|nr:MAG: hypothetical protein EA401_11270 [Planctomycetota bacterium]